MTAVTTPMPGLVVALHVTEGATVAAGERLCTVETMKCQSAVLAPAAGTVADLRAVGELVAAGDTVAQVRPAATPRAPRTPLPTPAQAVATALDGWGDDAWFTELDLEAMDPVNGEHLDALVPVHRPLGEQQSGVVVGLMTHRFPGHARPTTRVWLAGDAGVMRGAVAEDECRRIIAAFDHAEAHGLPVEWVAISAGAQISMERGTENMDWCAAVVRRILEFTQRGHEVVVIVAGINVGAQSYWNSVATMLGHCRGLLVMVDGASMVLTGHRALAMSGGQPSPNDAALGGYAAVMGPNGEAHHRAADLAEAYDLVLRHHALLADTARALPAADPVERDVCLAPYEGVGDHATVGAVLDGATNPTRTLPFAIRPVMAALADADAPRLERWSDMAGADGAVVWDTALAGRAITLVGIESHPRPGQDGWSAAGTLYPAASKKIARAITHASGRRPVVVLANLAGFDGSAASLREQQLEWGAEIARSVVNFRGPIIVVTIGRFHGGAYVVFNKALHPDLRMLALADTKVSVIGGSAAAEVVLTGPVKARMAQLAAERPELDEAALRRAARAEVAAEFDAVHSVERAFATRSVDEVIEPSRLRPTVAAYLRAHAERPEARGRAEVTDLRSRVQPSADRPAASA
ncbi:MAG TPA: carboxyl transferase domain-containing protein [Candidatus Nanopelagicales bacterium]